MCLELGYISNDTHFPEKVQKLRPNTMVSFWKIYRRSDDGELRSPLYFPKAGLGVVAKNGWHISNRKSVKVNGWEWGFRVINKGIHVYITQEAGRRGLENYDGAVLVRRVQARRKDIVAYDCYGSEAVCTRIYVPSADRTKKASRG